VYSTSTGDLLQTLIPETTARPIVSLLLDPVNRYRLIGIYQDGGIRVWDYTDGALLKQVQLADHRSVVAATLNGNVLLVSDSKHVYSAEWSVKAAILPTTQVADMKICLGLASAPGRCFAWGDNKVNVFPMQDGKLGQYEQTVLPGPAAAFAADPTYFAVSDEQGAIFLYNHAARDKTPRKLHWHAHACSSLSFALDGAYLLSGGQEGVLVLWQLSTSGKQFLPRVGNAISALGVSSDATQYAVKLDDNCVKVLSASTLSATCEIAGPKRATVAAAHQEGLLMAAGGQIQSWHLASARATGLLHATAHTFAGPAPNVKTHVQEPNVTHMAVSPDGSWLCTADQWTTPYEDAADLGYTKPQDVVVLKFWQKTATSWQITTRLDAPHGNARITGLQALKGGVFVTAGEDQAVKFWRSKEQDSLAFRCSRVLRFAKEALHERSQAVRMAVSADGSLLALSGPSPPGASDATVLLVDPAARRVLATLAGLTLGSLQDIGFAGDALILVGNRRLVCWRVAEQRVVYALRWPERTYRASLHLPATSLSATHFCIATQESKPVLPQQQQQQSKDGADKLFIFSTIAAKPMFREKCNSKTLAVCGSGDGYVVLDDALVLRQIGYSVPSSEQSETTAVSSVTQGISALYGLGAASAPQPFEEDAQISVLTSQAVDRLMPASVAGSSLASLEQGMASLGLFLLGAPTASSS
jgi:NET1-associated nuclear protein 1 (U3 small nucleolar RNA-associated protein 17)